jgi:hypothetical protein
MAHRGGAPARGVTWLRLPLIHVYNQPVAAHRPDRKPGAGAIGPPCPFERTLDGSRRRHQPLQALERQCDDQWAIGERRKGGGSCSNDGLALRGAANFEGSVWDKDDISPFSYSKRASYSTAENLSTLKYTHSELCQIKRLLILGIGGCSRFSEDETPLLPQAAPSAPFTR